MLQGFTAVPAMYPPGWGVFFALSFYAIDEVAQGPHFKERGFFVEVDHPMTGTVTYPGRPFLMEKTPWYLRRPAPLLGQHNNEVYTELGYSNEDIARMRGSGII
ncbi:MAG: hypothetical protein EXR53_00865 [Dehalococcoidia bacterium]|nr:hypothetical protein [Dehalococcoidia bacterium]